VIESGPAALTNAAAATSKTSKPIAVIAASMT
jgi:hypothetical protein